MEKKSKLEGNSRILRSVIFVALAVFIYAVCECLSRIYRYKNAYDPKTLQSVSPDAAGYVSVLRQLSSEAASTHFELFGGVASLNVLVGSISVIIIVCAVQLVEYFFHTLHLFTHDTPFNQMVHSIEKELMVVGFTAFVFKIIVNSTDFLKLEWFHSLEYADVLVPLFSFAYCGLGIMLILISIKISNIWSQAYHHRLVEMLDSYFDLPGFTGCFPYGLWLSPFYPSLARIEFRIFHNIFCETYKIQKTAFAFNEYVEKVFEKYILMIIEIRPLDWLLVCVFVLLNWARVSLHLGLHFCGSDIDDYDDHIDSGGGHRRISGNDEEDNVLACQEKNDTILFTIAGAVIFSITLCLAIESRRLEVSIMRQKGIKSVHMYPSYLKYMEESPQAAQAEKYRLTVDELKASAEEVKYATIQKEMHFLIQLSDRTRRTNQLLQRLRTSFPSFVPASPTPAHSNKSSGNSDRNSTSIGGSGLSAKSTVGVSGKKRGSVSNKFTASVKQAWVSKKNVSKRSKRKSIVVEAAESSARISASLRTSFRSLNFKRSASMDQYEDKDAERLNGNLHQEPSSGPSFRSILLKATTIHEKERDEEEAMRHACLNSFSKSDYCNDSNDPDRFGVPLQSIKEENVDAMQNGSESSAEIKPLNLCGKFSPRSHPNNFNSSSTTAFAGIPAFHNSVKVHPIESSEPLFAQEEDISHKQCDTNLFKPSASCKSLVGDIEQINQSTHGIKSNTGIHVPGATAGILGGGWVEEEHAVADVFFLAWPELYLEGVQSLLMIIALYFALYFTNFIVSANSPQWKLLSILPALLCSGLLIYIVKCAVLLSALHAVDCDAILEVLEQTAGAKELSKQIQEKIVARLRDMGAEPQAELFDLFAQIDMDGSGSISRDEFSIFMNSIEIHSDRRRWMQVFRGIDLDFDHTISFEEFFLFLFPDHSVGVALKKKKERILELRVQHKLDKRTELLKNSSIENHTFMIPVKDRECA